jgi:chromosome segregation ATPase
MKRVKRAPGYMLGGIPNNAKGRRLIRDIREFANRGRYRLDVKANGERPKYASHVRKEDAREFRVYFRPSDEARAEQYADERQQFNRIRSAAEERFFRERDKLQSRIHDAEEIARNANHQLSNSDKRLADANGALTDARADRDEWHRLNGELGRELESSRGRVVTLSRDVDDLSQQWHDTQKLSGDRFHELVTARDAAELYRRGFRRMGMVAVGLVALNLVFVALAVM